MLLLKIAYHNVSLLHHNHEPESRLKESPAACYLQICALNRIEPAQLLTLVDETSDDTEAHVGIGPAGLTRLIALASTPSSSSHFFYYDRPFYMATATPAIDENKESVDNLWIERTILVQDKLSVDYERVTSFNEIHSTFKLMLNPIRNAIADINEKTKELKHFVVQFTTTTALNTPVVHHHHHHHHHGNSASSACFSIIHSLQPLTMRLLGCLDARVNGGLIKYVRELLNIDQLTRLINTVTSNPARTRSRRKSLLHQLYMSIKDQLNVLESGLSIHDRILRDVEARFSKDLNSQLSGGNNGEAASSVNFSSSSDSSNSKYQKNYVEHIKHMNELNKHLIECLKLVTLELNERWTKFC